MLASGHPIHKGGRHDGREPLPKRQKIGTGRKERHPHPFKKIWLPVEGRLRQTAIVPKHYDYLKMFYLWAEIFHRLLKQLLWN